MQAVRLARYHTRRTSPGALLRRLSRLVGRRAARRRQPARGARDLHAQGHGRGGAARAAHPPRHRLRAGQSAAGAASERGAPGDSTCIDSGAHGAFRPRRLLLRGSRSLREVCTRARHRADLRRSVRRLPARAPAARRNTSACAPTWSPTARPSPAGCPSACCAAARELMRRFREDRPADICFARGTFNSHPYVMGAMHEFLQRLESEPVRALYRDLDEHLERARARPERAAGSRAAAGAGREPVHDLDHLLPAAVALQLDVSILLARRRARPELGGHGAADLQPELHGSRLRRGRRPDCCRRPREMQRDGWWWSDACSSPTSPSGAACSRKCFRRDGLRALRRPSDRSARRAAGRAAPCSRSSRH